MFQELRQGSTIYVLDKSENPSLKMGQVLNVGVPAPVYNTQTAGITMGMQPRMEITVRAKVDGTDGDFAHLPATAGVHDYGTMIVADSREAMLSEVDTMKQRAQQELDRKEKNEAIVAACNDMFKTLNPSYAKEAERDEAIVSLNSRLDGIESTMSQVLKLLNKK